MATSICMYVCMYVCMYWSLTGSGESNAAGQEPAKTGTHSKHGLDVLGSKGHEPILGKVGSGYAKAEHHEGDIEEQPLDVDREHPAGYRHGVLVGVLLGVYLGHLLGPLRLHGLAVGEPPWKHQERHRETD